MITKITILPRWIIFSIDIAGSAISLFVAYLLRFNLDFNLIDFDNYLGGLCSLLVVNAIVFYLLRTYAGIIRYTSGQDWIRLFKAIGLSTAIIITFNGILVLFGLLPFIPKSIVLINALCSFLFLMAYRVVVKSFFSYIRNLNLERRKVIIFGAGHAGLITKRTIEDDAPSAMKVVAFIDDDAHKINNLVDGVRVYSPDEKLLALIKREAVRHMIISAQNISLSRKNEIVELCLENDVNVLSVPPIREWINGELRSTQIRNIQIEELLEREPIRIYNGELQKQFKGKRILVTGAAGSIGAELVHQLINYNPEFIVLLDQAETDLHDLEMEFTEKYKGAKFRVFIGDVRNKERIEHAFEKYKPHYVYHAAAYKHVPLMERHPSEAVLTNVLGTKNVADLSVKYNVQKFVMVSTDKAVNPTSVMGASKRIAEIYIQSLNKIFSDSGTETVFKPLNNGSSIINTETLKNGKVSETRFITTRFGNVLGSNGSVIPRFRTQIERGGPVTVTHPDITRYFMTIPEACQLVLEAGCMGKGGEIFIFDMGKSVRIIDLAKKMISLSGYIPDKDIKIKFTGLRPGEKLYEELLNDHENTIPTHHEKIMIAKVREYSFEEVKNDINDLVKIAHTQNESLLVKKMKVIVPEYISNNSVFEKLDASEEDVTEEMA